MQKVSIAEVQQKLEQLVKHCAVCGETDWVVEPDLFNVRLYNPWNAREFSTMPSALLVCGNCGNTHVINVETLLGRQVTSKKAKSSKSQSNGRAKRR